MVPPDELRNIDDIDKEEANELREMVCKVVNKHPNEFAAEDKSGIRTDTLVVEVCKNLHGFHSTTAYDRRFPEAIPQSTIDAFVEEGGRLGSFDDRETYAEEEDALRYAQVALSMLYPYLFKKRWSLPQDS
jgi:hypothetical protein